MPAGSRSTRPTGGSRSAPTRHRCGASATRMPSTIWSPARRMRSRRSAATSCCTRTASRAAAPYVALRTRATNELRFAVVGSMTDPEAAGAPRGEVRAWRRRCGHAGAGRTILGARHARPADHRRRTRRRGARYAVPVARAQRDGAPHRAAWPGAVRGRRVGHARRLPGPGRVPADARARRAGQGDPADRLRAAARVARRLAAVVHARALWRDPGPAQPRRRDRLAAQGALRLHRGHERSRVPRRADRVAAGG